MAMTNIAGTRDLGKIGEDIAATHLERMGYRVIARNWRAGHLEIDIICEKDGDIVFVEVKTRKSSNYGGPVGAISKIKQTRLRRAAMRWLEINSMWNRPCRFDVICLTGSERFNLEHFPNAFE